MKLNGESLLEKLGDIDPQLIREAEEAGKSTASKQQEKKHWLKPAIAAAACLVLMAAIIIPASFLLGKDRGGVITEVQAAINTENNTKPAKYELYTTNVFLWPWEELEIWEQYKQLNFNGMSYGLYYRPSGVKEAYSAGKLADGEAYGYDYYGAYTVADEKTETVSRTAPEKTMPCEIFGIKGVNEYYAVLGKLGDELYLFRNTQIFGKTLGELIDMNTAADIICPDRIFFYSGMHYPIPEPMKINKSDAEYLFKILSECGDAVCENNYETEKAENAVLAVGDDNLFSGEMVITADGYFYTTVFGIGCRFNIGTEKAADMLTFLKRNCTEKAAAGEGERRIVSMVSEVGEDRITVEYEKHTGDVLAEKKTIILDCREKTVGRYVRCGYMSVGDIVVFRYNELTPAADGTYYTASGVFIETDNHADGSYYY